jgi:hypothetical protein
MGRRPEICPIVGSEEDGGSDGDSRWVVGSVPEDGRGGWKEVLALDEFDTSYINRLYHEYEEPSQLAGLIDNFCRDRMRLGDVLNILGDTAVFLRLVGNRTTGRDVLVTRQLDLAYQLEHPGLDMGLHPDNDDFAETEAIALGRVPSPDPEVDPAWADDEDGDDEDL